MLVKELIGMRENNQLNNQD